MRGIRVKVFFSVDIMALESDIPKIINHELVLSLGTLHIFIIVQRLNQQLPLKCID